MGAIPSELGFLSQNRLGVKQLRHGGDHRKHDAQLPEFGSAKESAKLRAEDFRPVKPDPDAAFAKERVVFLRNRQIGERLVSADVERADDHGTIRAEGKRDGFVFFKLLVFARGRGALHEQKLRAQQTDAVAAQVSDLAGVFDASDIRGDLNMVLIGGRGRFERVGEIFLSLLFVTNLRFAQLFHLLCGRIQPQRALAAVENNGRAIGEFQGARIDAGQRRDTERAGKNGNVRCRAAPHGGKPHDFSPLHGGGVRGREILGHKNGVVPDRWELSASPR